MRSLQQIRGVGAVTQAKLNKIGIYNVADIANFMPFNYVDLNAITDVTKAEDGSYVLLKLRIERANKPFRKGNFSCFKAFGMTDDNIKVGLVWYNSIYACKFVVENKTVRCYGKLKRDKDLQIINPIYELAEDEKTKFSGIKPIYPTRGNIPQATFLTIAQDALSDFVADSIIDDKTANSLGLIDLTTAYKICHKPQIMAEIPLARKRIMLESLVKRISAYRLIKEIAERHIFYEDNSQLVGDFIKTLPYSLTPTQDSAVNYLLKILLSDKPLNGMLVGDVGSGKTIVALITAYFVACSNRQVALVAPTEILAEQHYNTFCKLLSGTNINISLLVGGAVSAQKNAIKKDIASGVTDIIIGTHAIFSKSVKYANLALVIIDEQHRFGVGQRTALMDKGGAVDVLTLSATPIPRSLRLTMFGDVDIINIDRRHENTNIKTAIVGQNKRDDMLSYIANECASGKQAYIVAPRIFDDEGVEMTTAEALYSEIVAKYGEKIKIVLLHGKMSAKDKQEALGLFTQNKAEVLISTTVIEVGIDVPNASIMAVFDAERFGLATLHQLRGRIGRNGQPSFCFLYTTKDKEEEIIRLKAMSCLNDGIAIAEKDYELRGAGDWLGENQSGSDSGGFSPTIGLIKQAKDIADLVDITAKREELIAYATKLNLQAVSLT